ncbi:MAG: RluA family pseudouridine synthase [Acutalibacteraceae bacterium]|nr:RluA family pseudouridine synthase [Acutalibacteraceae bacterium]
MRNKLEITVCKDYDGRDVYCVLKHKLSVGETQIRRAKKHIGSILLNGEPVFTNHTVKAGDVVTFRINNNSNSDNIIPCEGELDIVYEDDDVLILNKPAGLATHPSAHHYQKSLAGMIMNYYQKQNKSFVFRCINRLDVGTSGLTVIAKHAYAQRILSNQLHTDSFIREYTAVVHGITDKEGFVSAPIRRAEGSIIKRCIAPDGADAYTQFRRTATVNDMSILSLRLKTGRTHQIRVHMSHIGHPLVGDDLYGICTNLVKRHALHSSYISFVQPVTGERIEFSSDLPDDITRLIKAYEGFSL